MNRTPRPARAPQRRPRSKPQAVSSRKPLPIGIDDFKKLIEGNHVYVDKSLFIKELLDAHVEVALIPRMRRFGKTLNMSMLRYFFEKSTHSHAHLFEGLAIQKHPDIMDHQGKYPVIFLTLKDIKATTWKQAYDDLQGVIRAEFERHSYLVDGSTLSQPEKRLYNMVRNLQGSQALYKQSLKSLANWLTRYHNQPPIVLIDEYDAPVIDAYLGGYYKPMIQFMRGWLGGGLKGSSIAWGVVTGVLRIAGESMFSGPNNATPYTVLKPNFSSCFGLLEHEVRSLLEMYGIADKHEEIKRWYDGYTVGDQKGVYNPWSVIQCLNAKGTTGPYWANTGDPGLMQHLIDVGPQEIRERLDALLCGSSIEVVIPEGLTFPTLEKNADAIWALLLYSGYLTPVAIPSALNRPSTLRIPNEEVREIHGSVIRQWLIPAISSGPYLECLRSLAGGDMGTFSKILQRFLLSSWSSHHKLRQDPEQLYHTFLLGIVLGLGSHMPRSERESGNGRCDLVLIPKDRQGLGIVMEFKVCRKGESIEKAAISALKQIEERKYVHELREQGVKRILCIGLAFQGKDLCLKHFI